MKDYTVYSSKAKDGTLRMALHPMDCAPNMYRGYGEPRIKWPFRVLFLFFSDRIDDFSAWRGSCRGKDGYAVIMWRRYRHQGRQEVWRRYRHQGRQEDKALEWLVEGEES